MTPRDNRKGWLAFIAIILLLGLAGHLEYLDHIRGF